MFAAVMMNEGDTYKHKGLRKILIDTLKEKGIFFQKEN